MMLFPLAAPRLLPRRPSRALAEAMGAAATCATGRCPALAPLWPDLARALAGGAAHAAIHDLTARALHAASACHLDCPAIAALRDVAGLLDAEAAETGPAFRAA